MAPAIYQPCCHQIPNFQMRRRRFRPIPVRMLVPNFITLLAICAGLAIRLSTEAAGFAVGAIVFAAVLDGLMAASRMIRASRNSAELDSPPTSSISASHPA